MMIFKQYCYLGVFLICQNLIQYERMKSKTYLSWSHEISGDTINKRIVLFRIPSIIFILLRFYEEPFLRKSVFYNTFNRYILRRVDGQTKKVKFEDNTLCSFLNQAANIELVVLILSGIREKLGPSRLSKKLTLEFDQYDFGSKESEWGVDR